jgi:hypothetical protein
MVRSEQRQQGVSDLSKMRTKEKKHTITELLQRL